MAVQFIFGGSGRGKTYFLQHKIMEEAVNNPKKDYIMIVPEQFTMQTQKDMIKISPGHGIMNIDVQSFGSTQLFIPKEWQIIPKASVFAGAIEERNRNKSNGSPVVYLTGEVKFGSVIITYV